MGASASHQQAERRKQRAEKFATSRRGQRMMKSPRMQKFMAKREMEMQQRAELRKQQDEFSTAGERMWFSRRIHEGRLQYWAIMVFRMKYEVRQYDDQSQPGSRFTCNIIDRLSSTLVNLEVDGHYVCLLGWTKMAKAQIDASFNGLRQSNYLIRGECQRLLKQQVDMILFKKAADYPWFKSNMMKKYEQDEWLEAAPPEMLIRQLEAVNGHAALQQQMQNQLQTQTQNELQLQTHRQHQSQLHAQAQQQMQNQLQTQMQDQLQLQMQNQLQMQLQNQMQQSMQTQMTTQQQTGTQGMGT